MSRPDGITVRGGEVDLDPRLPDFVRDPYPFYAVLRELGRVVSWRQLGHRVCARYDDVSALLRDRRFGRQILHVATREELGWPEPAAHLGPFHAFERHSLLELEPPRHTRLRGFVNAAFLPRHVQPMASRIERLAHEILDGVAARGACDLVADYAAPLAVGGPPARPRRTPARLSPVSGGCRAQADDDLLALYAWRAPRLAPGGMFQPVSREGALILNNLLLCTLAATVLLGTLYPLFLDLLTGAKVSVGPPFFNATFVPICAPLFAALCVGPFLGWKRAELMPALMRLRIALVVSLAAAIVAAVFIDSRQTLAALAFGFGVWLIAGKIGRAHV